MSFDQSIYRIRNSDQNNGRRDRVVGQNFYQIVSTARVGGRLGAA